MQYLGGIRGAGVLKSGDARIARADYDFEGYMMRPGQVTASGEIRMSATVLKQIFGRKDLELLTDDGRLLSVRFSEKKLASASDTAHVDVAGDLPPRAQWRH